MIVGVFTQVGRLGRLTVPMDHPATIEERAYAVRRVSRVHEQRDGSTKETDGGTAFIVGRRCAVHGTVPGFVVTCNHVVWPRLNPADPGESVGRTIELRLRSWEQMGDRHYLVGTRRIDVSGLEEPREDGIFVHPANGEGDDIRSWIPYEELWTADRAAKEAYQGRSVYLAGYPDKPGFTSDRPVLSSGVLATDPRYSASMSGQATHTVLFQGFSWSGMSGGPVLAGQVGLTPSASIKVTGHMPLAVAGVNCGHISDGRLGGHSGWSGLFPSWLIRSAIDHLWTRDHER